MKKALVYIIAAVAVIAAIAVIHSINKSPEAPDIISAAPVKFDVPVGQAVTFKLTYRGISGKDDDLRTYGAYGFGSSDNAESDFIEDVKNQTDNNIYIAHNPYLSGRPFTAIEYEGRDVKAVYFDLDGDGDLSKKERLKPANVSEANSRLGATFLTPDFTVTSRDGQKVPFRVILWVQFYDGRNIPNIMWWPMGVYEGIAELDGEKMKFYLFPDFFQASYSTFGSSDYALIEEDYNNDDYVPRRSLSSLIVHDKTFYRVAVQPADERTIFVTLAEDKSPRGKIDFKVQGKNEFKYNINNATLRGATDNTINYSISGGMNELPEGDYVVSSGYLTYGDEGKYSTSFSSLPPFTVETGQTATVELGKPQVKVRAVELNRRYNSNREYKTRFSEDTPIYLDVYFTGTNGETYRGFQQQAQRQRYTREYIKANLTIADASDNTVVDEALEPG